MKWWWQLEKSQADLERELQSDLDLEEQEQRESGLPPEQASHAARPGASGGRSISVGQNLLRVANCDLGSLF